MAVDRLRRAPGERRWERLTCGQRHGRGRDARGKRRRNQQNLASESSPHVSPSARVDDRQHIAGHDRNPTDIGCGTPRRAAVAGVRGNSPADQKVHDQHDIGAGPWPEPDRPANARRRSPRARRENGGHIPASGVHQRPSTGRANEPGLPACRLSRQQDASALAPEPAPVGRAPGRPPIDVRLEPANKPPVNGERTPPHQTKPDPDPDARGGPSQHATDQQDRPKGAGDSPRHVERPMRPWRMSVPRPH